MDFTDKIKEIQALSGHTWYFRARDLGKGFKFEVTCDACYVTTVDTFQQVDALLSFVLLTAQGARFQPAQDTVTTIPLTADQAMMFNRREAQ